MPKPTAKGFKSGFTSFIEFLDSMAESAAENRHVEAAARLKVEEALREYETLVGKPYADLHNPGNALPWDPDHKGHLVNCAKTCHTSHCLTCGRENFGFVYCSAHR